MQYHDIFDMDRGGHAICQLFVGLIIKLDNLVPLINPHFLIDYDFNLILINYSNVKTE